MNASQIPTDVFSSADVWPPNNCSERLYGVPVMPNTTHSRVCGIQSTNKTLAYNCCMGASLQEYQCFLYCEYHRSATTFRQCYTDQTNITNFSPGELFCQSGESHNDTRSLPSSAAVRKLTIPRLGWQTTAILAVSMCIAWCSAGIVRSLHNAKSLQAPERRQVHSEACFFEQTHNYTKAGRQIKVSPNFADTPSYGTPIDSGINNNNRVCIGRDYTPNAPSLHSTDFAMIGTINGTSAAEPSYDAFFDRMSQLTARLFPAQSSVSLFYEAQVATGQTTYLTWIPTQICFNGTYSNCGYILGEDNNATTPVEFCGPVFVGNVSGYDDLYAIPQGQISVVYTG